MAPGPSYTGTGLGLSIAKQLVEKMGGDVRIQSQRDVGTRVEIDLSFDVDKAMRPRPGRRSRRSAST